MSNVIDFLERLGTDARLRHASDPELEQALIGAQIDPAVREAILLRDQRRLESLLGANPNVCCMIISPARQEDDEESEKKKDEDGDSGDEEQAVRLTPS
jgi:replication fork clamp-binding protein CrfC